MKRAFVLSSIILAIFAVTSMQPVSADIAVGAKLESFTLPDSKDAKQTLDGLKGENGSVLIFLSEQCPVVKGYDARINEIAAAYKAKGINFIGINSNATEVDKWKAHSDAMYKFPVLRDEGNKLADQLGATVTPEVYFFDKNNVLLYRGAIDNDKYGKTPDPQYLKTAFDSSLGGKAIEKTSTNATGCSIKRAKKADTK